MASNARPLYARVQLLNGVVSFYSYLLYWSGCYLKHMNEAQNDILIPYYITTDDSYVNVLETASAFSNNMASGSFSQTDIEASA
jgi:hypothetical protein